MSRQARLPRRALSNIHRTCVLAIVPKMLIRDVAQVFKARIRWYKMQRFSGQCRSFGRRKGSTKQGRLSLDGSQTPAAQDVRRATKT